MATWEDVRALGLALADTEESTSYRKPSLKVRGKMFACMSPHEEGALVLRCDPDERPILLETSDAFYVTPHYDGSAGYVLVQLESVGRDELAVSLEDSWLLARAAR